MKKIFHLGIVLAFLLALVPVSTIAHYEDDPLVVDLLAGQTEDIGDVKVWNDADNLYVQFVYTGDDCGFLEVHLQVDEDAFDDDIMTKKGNPIPGKFEKSYDVGCFTQHTFAYDLASEGFVPGDFLLIAAHAALGLEEFLVIVKEKLDEKDWEIANIDLIIHIEEPKIGPVKGQMKRCIAGLLDIDFTTVNVKAKTNEGFGDIGTGDAIAATAIVLLKKKYRRSL